MAKLQSLEELLRGRHFEQEILILCVRWSLRDKLLFRDLVEMMAERGLTMAHTTIMRWVQRYVPEFGKRWNSFARKAGLSWRVDETYMRVRGKWVSLYRAVDREGNPVDFRLSPKRDVAADKAFLRNALNPQAAAPTSITLDGYAASHRAVCELAAENPTLENTKLRSSNYRNKMIEQDHCNVKLRIATMLGFKRFKCAAVPIAGIALWHHTRKEQFSLGRLQLQLQGQAGPVVGKGVLAA